MAALNSLQAATQQMLRLTKKADYSLIALKHFAARRREAGPDAIHAHALSAKEVSDTCGIPLPVLSKLLQKLGKAGFLVAEYGTNGGYRLTRDPKLISTLEVIRAIDGPIVLANCFTAGAHCGHSGRCTVKRPLKRIHDGIMRLLDSVSIENMLDDDLAAEDPAGWQDSLTQTLVALNNTPKRIDPPGANGSARK
ncbi:MAG TPA: Rrf2 family transcriptional regulator [Bryobacteraceae bacterium]|nr:Rrf2 family transcriptional regulator [Bryobacteraceae bacterium]